MRNLFEENSLRSIDIDSFHRNALKTMEQWKFDESKFNPPYSKDAIDADKLKAQELENTFQARLTPEQRELKKIADIFEALLLWHGEQSEWLGRSVATMKTSRYDDYVNGIDAVVEFQEVAPGTASYVGLATDVTFSEDTTNKFDRIFSHIDGEKLGVVKYFHSRHMNFHGQLSKIPEVVIGIEKGTVLELAELWAEKRFKELAEHPVQIMILTQIREQLATFALYAEGINKPELAVIFRSRLRIIDNILAEKAGLVEKTKYELNDKVYFSIMAFLVRKQKILTDAKRKTA